MSKMKAAVFAACGQEVMTLMGDPQQLLPRAALLADLGIEAIITDSVASKKTSRPLPFGLWQIDPVLTVPQPLRRWSLFRNSRPSLHQVLEVASSSKHRLVMINLADTDRKELLGSKGLFQEIATACQEKRLTASTVSEMAAQLAKLNKVTPQRSILKRAA